MNEDVLEPHVVDRVQNLSIICDGDDEKYHSDTHIYDYVVGMVKKIYSEAQKATSNPMFTSEHIAGIFLGDNTYLLCYLNKQRKNNPYLFLYDNAQEQARNTVHVKELNMLKDPHIKKCISYRISNTLFSPNTFQTALKELECKSLEYDLDKMLEDQLEL